MTTDRKMCPGHDQILGRSCRYYADHGGKHNFARLDHDCALERELRRELDEMTAALVESLSIFDASWCAEHGHAPSPAVFKRVDALRKKVAS